MTDKSPAATEIALQRLVTVYVVHRPAIPVAARDISGRLESGFDQRPAFPRRPFPSWLQAHGHAQIFGWIGTFIIGIGYYSLSKMGRLMPFAVSRGWASWALWTGGRHTAMGGQRHRVELAPPAAGIGGAPTDRLRDFLRDGERPSVQNRARVRQAAPPQPGSRRG